ncbi:MAG: DMT family transporter [Gemmobacter sp.]
MSNVPFPRTATMRPADWLRLVILSLLWGGSFFFIEIAVPHLPALTIVALRVAMAAGVLALVLAATGTPFPPRAMWPALLVMGVLNNALPFTAFVLAQGQITGALASILNATTPLFTLVVAAALLREERMTAARLGGLVLGLGGVAVMVGGAAWSGGAATAMPYLLCLGAALSYAFASVWGRRFHKGGLAPMTTAFGMLAASALIMAPLAALIDQPWTLPAPPAVAWAAIAGMAVLSTAFAYLLFFRILADAGSVNVALVTFLVPASAIVLGILILGEDVLPRHLAGLALILGGLAVIDGRLMRR